MGYVVIAVAVILYSQAYDEGFNLPALGKLLRISRYLTLMIRALS